MANFDIEAKPVFSKISVIEFLIVDSEKDISCAISFRLLPWQYSLTIFSSLSVKFFKKEISSLLLIGKVPYPFYNTMNNCD